MATVPVEITVVDRDTDRPIPGTYVSINGIGRYTDSSGRALLTVPPASYTLTIRAPGYMPFSTPITIRGPYKLTLKLSRAVFR